MAEPTTEATLTTAAIAKLGEVGITVTADPKTGKQMAVHPSGVESEIPTRDEQLTELDAQIAALQDQRTEVAGMYEEK